MSGLPPDSGQNGGSVPPPGTAAPPMPSPAPQSPAAADGPAADASAPLTPAQQEAIARVTALAAARPPAGERMLSRAATVTIVAVCVLVVAMVMLAALVA